MVNYELFQRFNIFRLSTCPSAQYTMDTLSVEFDYLTAEE